MERDISSVIEAHSPEQMSVPVLIEKDQRCLQALFLLPHWWNNPVSARELASPPWDDRILTEDIPRGMPDQYIPLRSRSRYVGLQQMEGVPG